MVRWRPGLHPPGKGESRASSLPVWLLQFSSVCSMRRGAECWLDHSFRELPALGCLWLPSICKASRAAQVSDLLSPTWTFLPSSPHFKDSGPWELLGDHGIPRSLFRLEAGQGEHMT